MGPMSGFIYFSFLEVLSHGYDLLNHWSLVIEPIILPGGLRIELKVPTFYSCDWTFTRLAPIPKL